MKNIHVFAAELPEISVLESKVADDQGVVFTPLTDSQWSNLGFKVDRQFVALDNGYRIDFTYSAKDYPKAQVLERVNEVIDVLPHEPSKEYIGKITEEVNADFCARSIAKTIHFSAFYHVQKQTLIFDCKAALAQRALGLMLKLVESIETKTLHCSGISNSLTANMLAQLIDKSFGTGKLYFAGFEVGDLLVMQNKEKDVARFKGDYPTENIKELIDQGYEIKEIALSKDGLSFNLNHNFKIKGVKEQFQVEEAMFDNADDYEIHKQTIALELMTSHCEQLRAAFDKQNVNEVQEEAEDQDDGNESLIAEHNAKYQDSNGNDAFYEEAKVFVQESQHASVSRIQRKFRIGYNRAARLVEQLEANGIVTAPGHNGERTVLAE